MNMTMEEAKAALEAKEAMLRLLDNSDYKLVFEGAYFKDEAMRLPLALTNGEMQDEVDQRLLIEQVKAIGHTQVFVNSIFTKASVVKAGLEAAEKERVDAAKNTAYDDVTGEPIIEEEA
jgi:hypothetical protein